jgi:hypothetical protein
MLSIFERKILQKGANKEIIIDTELMEYKQNIIMRPLLQQEKERIRQGT